MTRCLLVIAILIVLSVICYLIWIIRRIRNQPSVFDFIKLAKTPYRLADAVIGKMNPARLKRYHLRKYPNSLVAQYYAKQTKPNDIDTLEKVVKLNQHKIRRAKDVVIHLRLGDVLEFSKHSVDNHLEYALVYDKNPQINEVYVKPYSYFNEKLSKMKDVKHIDLVYGSHIDIDLKKSKEYIRKLTQTLHQDGYTRVSVKTSLDPDEDFMFLCTAPRLITTGGGYSKLAKLVHSIL